MRRPLLPFLALPFLAVALLATAAPAKGAAAEPAAAPDPSNAQAKGEETRAFAPKAAPSEGSGAAAAAAAAAVAAPAVVPAAKVDEKADGEGEDDADKFPLHMGLGLSSSASNAWFAPTSPAVDVPINGGSSTVPVPGSNGMRQPNLSTSLSLSPSANIPQVADWMPKMSLGGSMSFSINNWFPAASSNWYPAPGNDGVYDRQIRMSDLELSLRMPGIFKEEVTGISMSPSLSTSIPLSITSRFQNKLTSLGANLGFGWDGPEWSWGRIGVSYSTGLTGNFYTADASTIPCEAGITLNGAVENPLENGDLPLQYAREAEIAENGECVLRGRQGLASLNNNLGASWSLGDHSVSTSLSWGLGFLRPLSERPELSSQFATGQNFKEKWIGNLSYSYKIPVDFDMSVSAGVGSSQGVFDAQGNLRFPFFDFFYPASGYSAAFVDLSVGI